MWKVNRATRGKLKGWMCFCVNITQATAYKQREITLDYMDVERDSRAPINSSHVGQFVRDYLLSQMISKTWYFLPHFAEIGKSVKQFESQIKNNILLGLIWIQTVCKGYPWADQPAASVQRIKMCFAEIYLQQWSCSLPNPIFWFVSYYC